MDWLQEMMYQQQMSMEQQMMAQEQQMMVNSQLLDYGQRMAKTKKKDVINYLQQLSNASVIEQLDEFETANARHICQGTKKIQILPKGVVSVPTTEGMVNVEYFLCQGCRLLMINKQSIWML